MFRPAFPDLTYTVEDEMAARDLVLTRFTARGTNLGPFLGHPPTGRVVTYSGFDMNRIEGGKIVESWVSYDALGLLQRPGAADSGNLSEISGDWRPRPESNRCARICSPLRNHSATWP